MIPAVVSTVMTAQMTSPTVTAASQNARNREWPDQRSAAVGEAGAGSDRCGGRRQVRVPQSAAAGSSAAWRYFFSPAGS